MARLCAHPERDIHMSSLERRRLRSNCNKPLPTVSLQSCPPVWLLTRQRPPDFIPPFPGPGWFSRLIEVAALISRARDFLVQFQHGRRPVETPETSIEKLEQDLHDYQLTVAMDDLLPIRDNKLFDKSKVVYLLLSYVYEPFSHIH